jgi:hypothetical protein
MKPFSFFPFGPFEADRSQLNDLIGFVVAFAALKVEIPGFHPLVPVSNKY